MTSYCQALGTGKGVVMSSCQALQMTSTLALALISCRIIGQQLGIAALEYPINPWVARQSHVQQKCFHSRFWLYRMHTYVYIYVYIHIRFQTAR